MKKNVCILGAGVTGLAAGSVSGFPVYEAGRDPGGICSSYYVDSSGRKYVNLPPKASACYRFETGGGHWIFGNNPVLSEFIKNFTPIKFYNRRSAVYLPDRNLLIPYPIQNHLRYFGKATAEQIWTEIVSAPKISDASITMKDWLFVHFGATLCEIFFNPFHELYTAGLWQTIAPQDQYKSPIELPLIQEGISGHAAQTGYNSTFIYPVKGLGSLITGMAEQCKIYYGKLVTRIDMNNKIIYFSDKSSAKYDFLLSTLPLNKMAEMTNLSAAHADPSTSVLVINIGAQKGKLCPRDHWVYVPQSKTGFHRIGFYSNVDSSFLPNVAGKKNLVSLYVEKSFDAAGKPDSKQIKTICENTIKELQDWKWIKKAEITDPTWIEVAYTWSLPRSSWKSNILETLEKHHIYQIGRFARWNFQGIAASIRDGLEAGINFKKLAS